MVYIHATCDLQTQGCALLYARALQEHIFSRESASHGGDLCQTSDQVAVDATLSANHTQWLQNTDSFSLTAQDGQTTSYTLSQTVIMILVLYLCGRFVLNIQGRSNIGMNITTCSINTTATQRCSWVGLSAGELLSCLALLAICAILVPYAAVYISDWRWVALFSAACTMHGGFFSACSGPTRYAAHLNGSVI